MPRWRRGIKAGDYYPKRPLTTTSHSTVTGRTVSNLRNIHFALVDCTQRLMLRERVELLTTGQVARRPETERGSRAEKGPQRNAAGAQARWRASRPASVRQRRARALASRKPSLTCAGRWAPAGAASPRRSLARAPRDLSLEEVDLAGARGARGMLSLEQCGRIDDAPSFSSGAAGRINHFRGPAERRAAPPWRIAAWRREYGLRLMKARMDMEDCLGP
jgi:hypothetical protein